MADCPDHEIGQLPVNLSSFTFQDEAGQHVTVSGYAAEMDDFLRKHPDFVKMKLPHPWHHPDYRRFSDQLAPIQSGRIDDGTFVSGVTTNFETRLADDHWRKWLVKPVDFVQSMGTIKARYDNCHLDIIEIGFHPVLIKCCEIFRDYTYVSSMFREEDAIKWILLQRKKLDQAVFLKKLKESVDTFRPQLDFDVSLAYQGFSSLDFAELSVVLQPYFPSLAPQDFYRYKTIKQLIERFGSAGSVELPASRDHQRSGVVISGMSCRFPSSVETLRNSGRCW